jgi:hypothetical protein
LLKAGDKFLETINLFKEELMQNCKDLIARKSLRGLKGWGRVVGCDKTKRKKLRGRMWSGVKLLSCRISIV